MVVFTQIPTKLIGPDSFGAKTTELNRFKALAESLHLSIPGFISFSMSIFRPALMRANILDGDGNLKPKDQHRPIVLTHEEQRFLFTSLEPVHGVPVSIRSDEPTAKGVGVFETKFATIPNNFEEFSETIVPKIIDILSQQFSKAANAFKARVGLNHEIGLQVMPIVGIQSKDGRYICPVISVSGFTLGQKRTKVVFGYGLGGGVSETATNIGGTFFGRHFHAYSLETNHKVRLSIGQLAQFDPSLNSGYVSGLREQILTLAKLANTDVYFEAQLLAPNMWVLTQISSQIWPQVQKPEGKKLLYIHGDEEIIGCGVVEVTHLDNRLTHTELGTAKTHHDQSLVFGRFTRDVLAPEYFYQYVPVAALCDIGNHVSAPVAHIAGIIRESGILYVHDPEPDLDYKARIISKVEKRLNGSWLRKPKRIFVWADELHGEGGIVAVD